MSDQQFSWTRLFAEFQARNIEVGELKSMIKETVEREHPNDPIAEFNFNEDGVEVILESGEAIDIDVDWNEIIIG